MAKKCLLNQSDSRALGWPWACYFLGEWLATPHFALAVELDVPVLVDAGCILLILVVAEVEVETELSW